MFNVTNPRRETLQKGLTGSSMVRFFDPGDFNGMERMMGGDLISGLTDGSLMEKALLAGSGTDSAAFTGGRSMIPEDLQGVLFSVTLREQGMSLWRTIPKRGIAAVVTEYTRRTSFGTRWGKARTEVARPIVDTGTYARLFETSRFYRDERQVSRVMGNVNTIVDPIAVEAEAGIQNVLNAISEDLFWGVPAAFATRSNGLFNALTTAGSGAFIKNMGGETLSSDDFVQATMAGIVARGGQPTHIFPNPAIHADLAALYLTAQRVMLSDANQDITGGYNLTRLMTNWGPLAVMSDIYNFVGGIRSIPGEFTRDGGLAPTTAEGDTTVRPSVPAGVTAVAGGTGGTIPTGNYYYAVASVNDDGESIAAYSAVCAVTLGQVVTVTVTVPAGGTMPTGYRIYRSAINAASAADCRYLWVCSKAAGEAGWVDNGDWVPGCSHLPFVDMREAADPALYWAQLVPAFRLPLPSWWTSDFGVGVYGTLVVPKTSWMGLIKNILPTNALTAAVKWDPLGLYP